MGVDQSEAILRLREGRQQLTDLIGRLRPEDLDVPGTIGGGEWSAKDLVAHITAWEALSLDLAESHRAGRVPRIATELADDSVDNCNLGVYQANRPRAVAEVMEEAQRVHQALLTTIEGMTPEEWATPIKYGFEGDKSLGSQMGGLTGSKDGPFRHGLAHIDDLSAYVTSTRQATGR